MKEEQTAEDFLSFSHKFKLGCLLTEQQNPKTIGLSDLAKNDLTKAINIIKDMDFQTMKILKQKIPELKNMYKDVNETIQSGGRIFICGCGATGRLSLVLETLWRQQCEQIYPQWQNKVCAFMAGGDAALIKSIQDFQDHPEFAEQQLIQLGFGENDILIGSTQGGETSWVIGAIWKSTNLSKRKPYILYGNTDQILVQNVERSRLFIQSNKINKINCNVGYMALAGSTRMQSTTILMHAIGLTLLGCDKLRQKRYGSQKEWEKYAYQNIQTFIDYLSQTDFSVLTKWIECQTQLYKQKKCITYHSCPYYAISILTDTTERSPTFSLASFPNKYQPIAAKCWCNMKIISQDKNQIQSWEQKVQKDWGCMLRRQIRGLNSQYWKVYQKKVPTKVILGFGIHDSYQNKLYIQNSNPLSIQIDIDKNQNSNVKIEFKAYPTDCRLSHHSLLKILLNTSSTLIMGRMDRYYSNIMTFVKPTNYKLIDRAARYVIMLQPKYTYQEVVRTIYKLKPNLGAEEAIVLKVIEQLKKQN